MIKIFAHLFDLAPRAHWIHLTPDSESGPWEFHPCASAQLFREVSLSCPAVVALPVDSRHLRPMVVARIKWSWRTGLSARVGENVSDE